MEPPSPDTSSRLGSDPTLPSEPKSISGSRRRRFPQQAARRSSKSTNHALPPCSVTYERGAGIVRYRGEPTSTALLASVLISPPRTPDRPMICPKCSCRLAGRLDSRARSLIPPADSDSEPPRARRGFTIGRNVHRIGVVVALALLAGCRAGRERTRKADAEEQDGSRRSLARLQTSPATGRRRSASSRPRRTRSIRMTRARRRPRPNRA